MTPLHRSVEDPRPLKKACMIGAMPAGSREKVAYPWEFLPWVPHWDPQNTRYTFSLPVVTPTPLIPPPKRRHLELHVTSGAPALPRIGTRPCRYGYPAPAPPPAA